MGLTQEAFGDLGGVKRLAQAHYEKGTRNPDSAYLSAIAAAGVDVQYVLTGRRSANASSQAQQLLNAYLEASPERQRDALMVLLGGAVEADQRFKKAKIGQQITVDSNAGAMNFGDVNMSTKKK